LSRKNFFSLFFVLLLAVSIGYFLSVKRESSRNDTKDNNDIKTVVTTIYPIYSISSYIAADFINVVALAPTTGHAHGVEPTIDMLSRLKAADLAIITGTHIDSWASKGGADANRTLSLLGYIKLKNRSSGEVDPHFWMDFDNLLSLSAAITERLSSVDTRHKEQFIKNHDALKHKIESLRERYTTLKECKNRTVLVTHDAFGYLLEPVGIKSLPLQDDHHLHEGAAVGKVAHAISHAKESGAAAVFFGDEDERELAQKIAKELKIKAVRLDTMESATDGKNGILDSFEENLKNIQELLDCKK